MRPLVQSADSLLFWVYRRSLRREHPIKLDLQGGVIDQSGGKHALIEHHCGSRSGPPVYEAGYVFELSHNLQVAEPLKLRISLQDYSKPVVSFVEFEYPNTVEWLDELAVRTHAYIELPQRLQDDLVFAIGEDNLEEVRRLVHSGVRLSDMNITGANDLWVAPQEAVQS